METKLNWSTEMNIREANKTDISAITTVMQKSYATVAQKYGLNSENCPKHPSNCSIEWIEGDFARGVRYFVIASGNEIFGCIALEKASEQTCYLERLAVIPAKRNKGAGLMLANYFIKRATEMGINKIGIGIISKQEELKNWYEKIGFTETSRKTFNHLPFEVAFMEYHIENR